MSFECSCDGDAPTVYNSSTPRARKRYSCDECASSILPGERYENVFGVWDGWPTTFRTCEPCYDLRVWVRNNVPCLCIMHGDMDEQMSIAVSEARHRAPEETAGLKFGFLRRKIARDRLNQQRNAA